MAYDFDKKINDIYSDVIQQYHFKLKIIDENVISLISKDRAFSLDFWMSRDGVDITYTLFGLNNEVIQYDIREYLVEKILAEDRQGIILEYETIYERIIIGLKIFHNTLNRCGQKILNGDKSWLEDYKKSSYFVEPRIEKRTLSL